jgi:ribosome recycling factor
MSTGDLRPEFRPAIERLEETLRGIRTGRASPGLVENIGIDVYGSTMPLKSIATISVVDAKTLHVEPWDKSQVQAIEKSIATSPLGVNPVTAGTVIRIPIPPLTEERRTELTKIVHQHAEEAKTSIRHAREKLLRDLRGRQTTGELSENEFERMRKQVQAGVDFATAEVERRANEKDQELVRI